MSGENQGLFATGILGFVKLFAAIPAVFYVDRIGRRPLFLFGTAGMLFSMMFIGFYLQQLEKSDGLKYSAVTCVYLFSALFSVSWAPLHCNYNPLLTR